MELTRNFKELAKNDANIAGGKGASLGEIIQANIPVPPGFVVLADTFERFITETDINIEIDNILHDVDINAIHTVDQASEQIQSLIKKVEMPEDIADEILKQFDLLGAEYVAVRSSATAEDSASAAWAGQLDSFLNTTKESLLDRVQDCWSSLFTPRAIFYRFEKDLHTTKISVAVVVQKMVNSEKSGIAFSVHPVTEDHNQLIIESGFGLGEAIVSGQITPDSYVVEKEPRRIIDINIAEQTKGLYRIKSGGNEWQELGDRGKTQVLAEKEILELSEIILKIEDHYGFPCDIEWAQEGGVFYIVQSRPITTLSVSENKLEKSVTLSKIYSREKSVFYFCVWRDSDLQGVRKFLGEDIEQILFIIPPKGKNGEVWYSLKEIDRLTKIAINKINGSEKLRKEMVDFMKSRWEIIRSYFEEEKEILDIEEAVVYFNNLVDFWTPISTIYFELPNMEEVDEDWREQILSMRVMTEKYTDKMSTKFVNFFEKKYPQFARFSHFITPTEAKELSDNPNDEKLISTLEERVGFGAFLLNEKVYPLKDLDLILKNKNIKLENIDVSSIDEIQGNVAYPGLVKGLVKVISGKNDIKKIKEGDVLVASMTNPEYVPYMQKAVAFVTDEGGITCHASIVAREMKKPCIIGTKVATQVLKDGDMVEVDATNGIVRIISDDESYDLEDYSRMFSGKAFSFLLSDLFMSHYKTLGVLSVFDGKTWMSLIPKIVVEKTQKEGKKLYESESLFREYKKAFIEYIEQSEKDSEIILKKDNLSSEGVSTIFNFVTEHFLYYQKTEFFYTDHINHNKMSPSIKEFDELKLRGRSHLNKIIFEETGYINSLIRILSKQLDLDQEYLKQMSANEIMICLETKKVPKDFKPEDRLQGYFQAKNSLFFGNEGKNKAHKFINQYQQAGDIIKGTTANVGYVKARAFVVNSDISDFESYTKQVDKMEKGDILVAETTSPEIIHACKKASAIITNQGGMLSHAAIISRELNIPCVIGTDKDVLENIKTGDLVEVDANNGTIIIIK